jgi:hypothetical protein
VVAEIFMTRLRARHSGDAFGYLNRALRSRECQRIPLASCLAFPDGWVAYGLHEKRQIVNY